MTMFIMMKEDPAIDFVKARDGGKIMNALYRGLIVSGVLALVAFYPITAWLIPDDALGGAFLATAPLLVLFIFVGRRLVSGVMDGAVKG